MAATVCASGQRRFAELFFTKINKTGSKISFEKSLIVVEAIGDRGQSAYGARPPLGFNCFNFFL